MLRVAMLGAGSIVRHRHLPAWKAQPDAEIVALVDVREEAAEQVAREHGIPRWTTDYREVLANDDIDAIDVCLPHHLHAPIGIDCLRAGKHVLMEKPIALDLDAAKAMVGAAEQAGKTLMIAENWRFAPAAVEVARMIGAGELGTPLMLKAAMEFNFQPKGDQPNWRLRGEQAGGGVLLDSGIHTMSVARMLMGEMTEIAALRGRQTWAELAPLEDTLVMAVRFDDASVGVLDFSWRAQRTRHVFEFEVLGSDATAVFDIASGALAVEREGNREERPQLASSGFEEEIRHFVDCLRDGAIPRTSGLEEARTLAAVLAAYRSVESGRVERVERM